MRFLCACPMTWVDTIIFQSTGWLWQGVAKDGITSFRGGRAA